MRTILWIILISVIPIRGLSVTNQAIEHYIIKLYLTESTTYDIVPSDLYVDRSAKVITLYDGGKKFQWVYSSVETLTHNVHFKYDYFHISGGNPNISRIVISKRAEVREKHDGKFYYRIVMGDKTYLASKSTD